MKNNYKIIIVILFLLFGCSKENPIENNSNKYIGTWQWLKTVGGFAPQVITPKDGEILKISYDNFSTFKVYRNDTLKVIADYKIEETEHNGDKISYSNVTTYDFNFYGNPEYPTIYSDTLEIWDGMFDGFFSFYLRIN